jgi:hypothetical protein
LKFIEYVFEDVHINGPNGETNPDFWLGNEEIWDYIMKNIELISNISNNSKIDGKIIR